MEGFERGPRESPKSQNRWKTRGRIIEARIGRNLRCARVCGNREGCRDEDEGEEVKVQKSRAHWRRAEGGGRKVMSETGGGTYPAFWCSSSWEMMLAILQQWEGMYKMERV